MSGNTISLNKFISDSGYCSRREADELIEEGRVKVNGKVARRGNRVYEGDRIEVDDEKISMRSGNVYLLLNKPVGITCTTDSKDRTNIVDYVDYPQRVFPVGRLDKDSSGLILLTNNGDIVNKILRAENKKEKEYLVRVNRPLDKDALQQMRDGVKILGRKTKPAKVRKVGKVMFSITLIEGMNRQIRRMCQTLGYRVNGLERVRIMHFKTGNLKPGKWRRLNPNEAQQLEQILA